MIFKRISSICFAIGFLLAIVVFTNYGSSIIPKYVAKMGIVLLGGIALLMNLLSFRYDSTTENNIIFWIGSVVIYVGLILKMNYFPYNQVLIIAGVVIIAVSWFFNPFAAKDTSQEDELLDQ